MRQVITQWPAKYPAPASELSEPRVIELPEPRPLQHGYEAISWQDTPIGQLYGVPGESRHPAKSNNQS